MKEEDSLYFGLDYYESVEAKKNLLSVEMFLVNIMKIMRKYHSLRAEELRAKLQLQKAIKKLNMTLRKTNSFFPFSKASKKTGREKLVKKEIKVTRKKADEDLELQLKEIQGKLKSIS